MTVFNAKSKIIGTPSDSPSEIMLTQDGNRMHLKATGSGSDLSLLTAYTKASSKFYKLHFRLLLKQWGKWDQT